MNENRQILLQNLIILYKNVASGSITIEQCQRKLSSFIYLSDIEEQESLAKEYDNKLEIILFTLSESQVDATLKTLKEIMNTIQTSLSTPD